MQAHDAFEWWAQIVIPSLMGLATWGVSVVALVSSANATRIAHAVEAERDAAEKQRERDARAQRLQDLALADARVLQRWFIESRKPWLPQGRTLMERVVDRAPGEAIRDEAESRMRQSIVPAAHELWEITEFDIAYRREGLPPGGDEWRELTLKILGWRDERTRLRIRSWALDPQNAADDIYQDLHRIETDPDGYLASAFGRPWEEDANASS